MSNIYNCYTRLELASATELINFCPTYMHISEDWFPFEVTPLINDNNCFFQSMDPTAVWKRVSDAGFTRSLGCHIC